MSVSYFVQTYHRKDGLIWPDPVLDKPTKVAALVAGQALAKEKVGVSVYSIEIDEDTGFIGDKNEFWCVGQVMSA